jgi:predicted RNase H-like HicB family nuclease
MIDQATFRYQLIIYWSEADHAFIVEVPELAGCMADGESYEDALANAKSVIESWVETARALGRPIPEPRGGCSTPEMNDCVRRLFRPISEKLVYNSFRKDETAGARPNELTPPAAGVAQCRLRSP